MAKTFYATPKEYKEFRQRGFKVVRAWKGCHMGEIVDIYGPDVQELGLTATVTDVKGNEALLEVW